MLKSFYFQAQKVVAVAVAYRRGGRLLEVPTVRLLLGKFMCFGLAVAYIKGGGRLQAVVAHGGSTVHYCVIFVTIIVNSLLV